ncbi:MAG: ATP-binding cassette domain-containing protein, partial [Rhodobacterales bacterium]|nr:ATP-binding cassette domain-containing protein [Rhodobacterales bacterium]
MPQTGTQRKDTLLSPLGPGWAEHGPAETGLVARGLRTDRLGPVDLDVAPGAALAVMGASGSGKTLLLRALADLDPARGDLSWRGVDRFAMAAPAWRRRVAYVPAEPGWWAATPADHMADHMANGAAARALLPAVDLTDDHLARPIAHLSTGERQRLALVRALILAPEVLL